MTEAFTPYPEEDICYSWSGHFHIPKYCATCHFWDREHIIDGFATCYQLLHSRNGWRLGTVEQVPPGDTSIVRTKADFVCKYWEGE